MSEERAAEQALIGRIRDGDAAAFEVLFRTHHAGLLRFAHAQMRERAAAEDVVHDVFLRVWRGRTVLSVETSVRAYLLAATRHRVIDLERQRAVASRTVDVHADVSGLPAAESVMGNDGDPAQAAELNDAIERAVAALPERCRTAFLLCREEDLTYAEAADAMGVKPATVKTQVARALAALRSALAPFLALVAAASATLR